MGGREGDYTGGLQKNDGGGSGPKMTVHKERKQWTLDRE